LACLFGLKKPVGTKGDNIVIRKEPMTREEELKILEEYLEKHGATLLPPDQRGPEDLVSVWRRSKKKKKAPKKVKKK